MKSKISYVGFWLNLLGIGLSIFLVFYQAHKYSDRIDTKVSTIKSALLQDFSDKISGAKDINNAADSARLHIQTILFDRTEDALRFEVLTKYTDSPDSTKFVQEYERIKPFVESLQIRENLKSSNPNNVKDLVSTIYSKIKDWLINDSFLLENRNIFYIWIGCSALYLIIVALSYFGGYLATEKGEPIFNIIDISLYLILVEYSGGFQSLIIYIITISIIVFFIDASLIRKTLLDNYHSLWNAINLDGIFKVFAKFAPSLLYCFTLLTGLIWATIDGARTNHTNFSNYITLYIFRVAIMFVLGLIGYFLIRLINPLIPKSTSLNHS